VPRRFPDACRHVWMAQPWQASGNLYDTIPEIEAGEIDLRTTSDSGSCLQNTEMEVRFGPSQARRDSLMTLSGC